MPGRIQRASKAALVRLRPSKSPALDAQQDANMGRRQEVQHAEPHSNGGRLGSKNEHSPSRSPQEVQPALGPCMFLVLCMRALKASACKAGLASSANKQRSGRSLRLAGRCRDSSVASTADSFHCEPACQWPCGSGGWRQGWRAHAPRHQRPSSHGAAGQRNQPQPSGGGVARRSGSGGLPPKVRQSIPRLHDSTTGMATFDDATLLGTRRSSCSTARAYNRPWCAVALTP
jgi:hypothetical protein